MMGGGIIRRCGGRCVMSLRIMFGMSMGGSFGTLLVSIIISSPPSTWFFGC